MRVHAASGRGAKSAPGMESLFRLGGGWDLTLHPPARGPARLSFAEASFNRRNFPWHSFHRSLGLAVQHRETPTYRGLYEGTWRHRNPGSVNGVEVVNYEVDLPEVGENLELPLEYAKLLNIKRRWVK